MIIFEDIGEPPRLERLRFQTEGKSREVSQPFGAALLCKEFDESERASEWLRNSSQSGGLEAKKLNRVILWGWSN